MFDYHKTGFVDKVVTAAFAQDWEFIGIFDAISTQETYDNGLTILAKLGGGHLAAVHPPPTETPENAKTGTIFAINDAATPVWNEYVSPALESGKPKCLPPLTIVGKGLEYINEALSKSKVGVSATKLVVRL